MSAVEAQSLRAKATGGQLCNWCDRFVESPKHVDDGSPVVVWCDACAGCPNLPVSQRCDACWNDEDGELNI